MPNDAPISSQRPERILAVMAASAVGLSIACFLAVIIATGSGIGQDGFSAQPWPTIIVLPVVGLPLGATFLIALVVISSIRRGREKKDDRK